MALRSSAALGRADTHPQDGFVVIPARCPGRADRMSGQGGTHGVRQYKRYKEERESASLTGTKRGITRTNPGCTYKDAMETTGHYGSAHEGLARSLNTSLTVVASDQTNPSHTSTPCVPLSLQKNTLRRTASSPDGSAPSTFNLDPDTRSTLRRTRPAAPRRRKRGGPFPRHTPQIYRGGCPHCGHDRMMGGSCNECGYDDQTGFRPSADCNKGG